MFDKKKWRILYYRKNRRKILEYQKEYNTKHRDAKIKYDRWYFVKNRKRLNSKSRDYYHRNRERLLILGKEYRLKHRDERLTYEKEYRRKHRKKINTFNKEWKKTKQGRLITKAVNMVRNAVAKSEIIRLNCEICGNPKSQAHHNNYNEPLKVTWLCKKHHIERHSQMRNMENAL